MKIHCVVAVCALVISALLRLTPAGWATIFLCIIVVFAAECFNTAIEAVVDLVTEEYAPLARVAKDCAAGAVCLCAIGSVAVGLVVFIPAFLELIGL